MASRTLKPMRLDRRWYHITMFVMLLLSTTFCGLLAMTVVSERDFRSAFSFLALFSCAITFLSLCYHLGSLSEEIGAGAREERRRLARGEVLTFGYMKTGDDLTLDPERVMYTDMERNMYEPGCEGLMCGQWD